MTQMPYDEILDVYLRSRGWWSKRTYSEAHSDRDFFEDQWTWVKSLGVV